MEDKMEDERGDKHETRQECRWTRLPLMIIDLQNKDAAAGQDENSLVGGSEAQDGLVRVQAGQMLLSNLLYLTAPLSVEEDRFQWRRLTIDERTADALAQDSVGEVWRTGDKLFIPLGGLHVTWSQSRDEDKGEDREDRDKGVMLKTWR